MDEEEKRGIVTVEEIESLLEQLPGIQSARIVVNDWGAIEEVHILATAERNPKQVVRDVESSLAARWGINVDHKKVSVAQLTGVKESVSPVRLKILQVSLAQDTGRNQVQAKVLLGKAGEEDVRFEGIAEAANSVPQARRALAQATLSAVNQVIQADYSFLLEEVGVTDLGPRTIVLVTVALITPRGNEEVLAGAVVNKGDPNGAVVKAVLDAINRRLAKVSSFPKSERRPLRQDEPPVRVGP